MELRHHPRCQRDDNRVGNPELWVWPRQPHGQRVSDVVAWIVAVHPAVGAAAVAVLQQDTASV